MADSTTLGASPSGRATAVEPVPVSALRDGIPDAGDGTRGPEWAEMEARHAAKGVVYWHADRVPGATDEQVAAALNKTDRWLSVPENNVSSRLRGEAFILRDSAECTLRQFNCETLEPVEPSGMERARAKGKLQLADLLIEAAMLLEQHAQANESADAMLLSRKENSNVG